MYKNYKILTSIILFVLITLFLIINQSIDDEKNFLSKFKSIISKETKIFLKETFFVYKYKEVLKKELIFKKNQISNLKKINEKLISNKILVKATNNSFELTEDDSIFIYQKSFINIKETSKINYKNNNNLKIYSFNIENKKECYRNEKIQNYFEIKIKDLKKQCRDSIFFQGVYNNTVYFYFSLKGKPIDIKNKNLLVLPVSTFFDYTTNIDDIRLDHDTKINYIHNSNEVPTSSHSILKDKWPNLILKSFMNMQRIFKEFNIINDYELERLNLDNFENIIMPMHQESISIKALENLLNYLQAGENKKILSIGGGNFLRRANYHFTKEKMESLEFTHEFINFKKYNLNLLAGFSNDIRVKKIIPFGKIECNLKNKTYSKYIELGEIMYPFNTKNTDHYFYDIVCPDIKLPLLSVTNFGSGKLIQINSDGVGANLQNFETLFNQINELVN